MAQSFTLDQVFDFLSMLDHGEAMLDLMEDIKLVQGQCRAKGGKGSVTLKIEIEDSGSEKYSKFTYLAKTSTSLPSRKNLATTLFTTEDGVHTRDDPKQHKMAFIEPEERGTRVVE